LGCNSVICNRLFLSDVCRFHKDDSKCKDHLKERKLSFSSLTLGFGLFCTELSRARLKVTKSMNIALDTQANLVMTWMAIGYHKVFPLALMFMSIEIYGSVNFS
jgi:hypothetical protein